MENALKALAYSSEYTLIGCKKFSDAYVINSKVWPKVSKEDYLREQIIDAMEMLSRSYQVSFSYEETSIYSFKNNYSHQNKQINIL